MAAPSSSGTGIDRWVTRLRDRDMPVLGNTVQKLCAASTDYESSAGDLATVVLQDAAMTSGVLKIANSAYYNSGAFEINTISRAVILLGFDAVRSIGLSLTVIDSFLKGRPKQQVLKAMQQSLYAAVQAKLIAQQSGDRAPEEIFIATLLYRLGEMAFWTFASDKEAGALTEALAAGKEPKLAELETVGFTLRQLSSAIAREWHLGEVLQDALQPAGPKAGRALAVQLGHDLEASVREHGWESAEVRAVTERIAKHAKVSPEKAKELIVNSRRELQKAAEAFGVSLKLNQDSPTLEASPADQPVRKPDPMLQLKVLRELAAVLERKPDVQQVLDMVMEGIYRGIAMDRALLAVLTPDRKSLKVKYALGDNSDGHLAQQFRVELNDPAVGLLKRVLEAQQPVWTRKLDRQLAVFLTPLKARLCDDFLIGPLVIRGREIGLIYADRKISRRALGEEDYDSFQHFIKQANICIEHIARR